LLLHRKSCSSGQNNGETLLSKLRSQTKLSANGRNSHRPRKGLVADGESCPSEQSSYSATYNENPSLIINSCGTDEQNVLSNDKLLKPISGIDFPTEDMRAFAEIIQKALLKQKHELLLYQAMDCNK
jgi:hypothetical protein